MVVSLDEGTGSRQPSQFQELSAWVANLRAQDLPPDAIGLLKNSVRDGLACAVFGSLLPWSEITAAAMLSQHEGSGAATVLGTTSRLDGLAAALVNGATIQSYEMDDLHTEASIHGASVMVPAVLALAEIRGDISGDDLLAALAAGWEVALRINRCVGDLLPAGWHPPTIMGTLGATAAAGHALRLSPEQMAHCLALGVLQATGLTVVQFDGMAKRLYAGRAAEVGVQCALLAEQGYTAPVDSFENPMGGFLSTYRPGGHFDLDVLTEGLGREYAAASAVAFKLYSCCGAIHPALDVLIDLVHDHPEITVDTVAKIDTDLAEHTFKHVGFPYEPGNTTTAQFNVEYAFAVYLLEGAVFIDQFRDELLDDPRILDLVHKMTTRHDPTLETSSLVSRRAARVAVHLKDGQVFTREGMTARGQPMRPASEEELRAKFDRLVRDVLSANQADELSTATQHIEELKDVAVLARLTIPSSKG